MQYQTLRSISDPHVYVLLYEDTLPDLPEHVRKQGPWRGMRRGEIDRLKPAYRVALAREGYALVKCESAVFKPEA